MLRFLNFLIVSFRSRKRLQYIEAAVALQRKLPFCKHILVFLSCRHVAPEYFNLELLLRHLPPLFNLAYRLELSRGCLRLV